MNLVNNWPCYTHPAFIRDIIDNLKNESAGNSRCTMTDLDMAVGMLENYNYLMEENDKTLKYNNDMTTKTQSLTADEVRNKILSSTGQFVKVKWQSEPKPAAAFKAFNLKKITEGVVRSGIDYANLSVVKEGIESGERGEVKPLPFGQWKSFPYIIEHLKDGVMTEYIRLYPSIHRPHSIFYVNDELVTKEEFAKYLTPSEASKLLNPQGEDVPLCFTIKASNILSIPVEVTE